MKKNTSNTNFCTEGEIHGTSVKHMDLAFFLDCNTYANVSCKKENITVKELSIYIYIYIIELN